MLASNKKSELIFLKLTSSILVLRSFSVGGFIHRRFIEGGPSLSAEVPPKADKFNVGGFLVSTKELAYNVKQDLLTGFEWDSILRYLFIYLYLYAS